MSALNKRPQSKHPQYSDLRMLAWLAKDFFLAAFSLSLPQLLVPHLTMMWPPCVFVTKRYLVFRSAQLIWLWLVERSLALGFFEVLGIWRLSRLGLGRFWYGQWLGLGNAPLPDNNLTHTHTASPAVWGAANDHPET